jgi:hypothetical protein
MSSEKKKIIEKTKVVVSKWDMIAIKYQISKLEREMMNVAFRF